MMLNYSIKNVYNENESEQYRIAPKPTNRGTDRSCTQIWETKFQKFEEPFPVVLCTSPDRSNIQRISFIRFSAAPVSFVVIFP